MWIRSNSFGSVILYPDVGTAWWEITKIIIIKHDSLKNILVVVRTKSISKLAA
jgi:hypothetical protein